VKARVMKTSDHWPCVIEINTKTPRSRIFRFENHWLDREDFITVLIQGWSAPYLPQDPAKAISAKCKKKNPQETTKDLEGKVTVSGKAH
jgi:hypothetical protein